MRFFLALLIALSATASFAQSRVCSPERAMLAMLANSFNEQPIWRGSLPQNARAILTGSPEGSWTFLGIQKGTACILAAGHNSEFDKGV